MAIARELTRDELEVVRMLKGGLSPADIARRL
jgi:DNA-binding CsgD family transcriptional regulator